VFDLEYLGVGKDLPEQQLSQHYSKEEISAELSAEEEEEEEEEYNKSNSKKRIVIEHTICRFKKFIILADILETN
jgi:hypothetical protein